MSFPLLGTHPTGLRETEKGGDALAHCAESAAVEKSPAPARLVIVGCSGHARVVVDAVEEQGEVRVVGLLDTYKSCGTQMLAYQTIGSEEDVPALLAAGVCDCVFVAIGDNWMRGQVVRRIQKLAPNARFATVIHPSARVARGVSIGCGTVIMAGAVINTGSRIGEFCILNTSSSLDHECVMSDFSSLAPRAVTGGRVNIGAFSAIAIGATVSHELTIGDHTLIGAGATVVNDIQPCVVAYGTPARVIRNRNPEDPYLERSRNSEHSSRSGASSALQNRSSLTIIPAAGEGWQPWLERTPHDIFHTARYHQLHENSEAEACLAVYGGPDKFVAWPYLIQNISEIDETKGRNLRDVTSVYGYSGPLTYRCAEDRTFLAHAQAAIMEAWRSQSVVSAFTRFHPLLSNYASFASSNDVAWHSCPDENPIGKTVAIDLSRSQEQIVSGYSRCIRQALRRCKSLGMITIADPEWTHLDDFIRIYYQTMRRNNAEPFYLFPHQYLRRLKEAVGRQGTLMLTRYQDKIISVAVILESCGIATLHLLGSDDEFVHLSPSKLLFHEAQTWAQTRQNRFLHLGGGRRCRDDDSLFSFKALFSRRFFPFYTARWILDRSAYEVLSSERRRQADTLKNREIDHSYFPAYRAPFRECVEDGQDSHTNALTHSAASD